MSISTKYKPGDIVMLKRRFHNGDEDCYTRIARVIKPNYERFAYQNFPKDYMVTCRRGEDCNLDFICTESEVIGKIEEAALKEFIDAWRLRELNRLMKLLNKK